MDERAAASQLLPDDLIAEILARVPYKSLCRFKCVSRPWLALCSDPSVRRRCPQTLSGFFVNSTDSSSRRYIRKFVNLSGRGPPMVDASLSFLPSSHRDLKFIHCCNGLILCERQDISWLVESARYFVCNPATERWIDLPYTQGMRAQRLSIWLGFEPAVSSHFRVFLFIENAMQDLSGVEIYSSDTGGWVYRQSEWGDGTKPLGRPVFFNNTMHFTTNGDSSLVLTVDMDGKTWRKISTPHAFYVIGFSQGQLHCVQINNRNNQLLIWVLEDYDRHQWILKDTVSTVELCGRRNTSEEYFSTVCAIHLEHSLIFYDSAGRLSRSLMSYDMDNKNAHTVVTCGDDYWCIHPYIPCFLEW